MKKSKDAAKLDMKQVMITETPSGESMEEAKEIKVGLGNFHHRLTKAIKELNLLKVNLEAALIDNPGKFEKDEKHVEKKVIGERVGKQILNAIGEQLKELQKLNGDLRNEMKTPKVANDVSPNKPSGPR